MQEKAKGIFLKKLVTNGFAVYEEDDKLILRPRGGVDAMVKITQSAGVWRVIEANGAYRGFDRGKKRAYFETTLSRWQQEAQLEE